MPDPRDLDRAAAVARRAVQTGLAVARRFRTAPLEINPKEQREDIVTQVDIASEEQMASVIAEAFPDDGVVGEEGTRLRATSRWRWRIDPLDGTHNYAYGLPLHGASAVLHHDSAPVVAALGHEDALVTAVAGHGIHFTVAGSDQVPASQATEVRPAAALWLGYGSDRANGTVAGVLGTLNSFARRTFESWAPTVDVILYLRGGVDVVVAHRCRGDELPAALLVLREAGAVLLALDGQPFEPGDVPDLFIAGRPEIAHAALAALRERLR